MKLNLIRPDEALACVAGGIAGAVVFLFAFPKGSISTLMHAVLHLPGPGAGIALVVGPFAVFVALVAFRLTEKTGAAVIASVAFAAAQASLAALLGIATDSKGAFGSPMFVAALALLGIIVDATMLLGRALTGRWRCMIAGTVANAVLLVLYWAVIFPRTYRPVARGDIPLLLALALAGGLLWGYMAWAGCRLLSRTFGLKQKQ